MLRDVWSGPLAKKERGWPAAARPGEKVLVRACFWSRPENRNEQRRNNNFVYAAIIIMFMPTLCVRVYNVVNAKSSSIYLDIWRVSYD